MIRSVLLTPALAIIALLVTPTPAWSMANPDDHFAYIEIDLAANNGLHAHIETNSEGVYLEIHRKHRFVIYRVEGESTEAGLKVKFGDLGRIDAAFTPTKTRVEEPPTGCTGPPSTTSDGIFVGAIEFTGEREFVQIAMTEAQGRMSVYRESEWQCRQRKRQALRRKKGSPSALGSHVGSSRKREPAILAAASRSCSCYFAAYGARDRKGHGWSTFVGAKFEQLEAMEIRRFAIASAGPSAFAFNHKDGTARVRPPNPFTGRGIFKRRPHRRDLWQSTIRVPLLGADPLSVGGPGFRAVLVKRRPGDE